MVGLFRVVRGGLNEIFGGMGQRYLALFFISLFWLSILVPGAAAIGAEAGQNPSQAGHKPVNSRIKPFAGDTSTKPEDLKAPKPLSANVKSNNKFSADYTDTKPAVVPGLPGLGKIETTTKSESLQTPDSQSGTFKAEELVDKRTANTKTFRNKDGSLTLQQYASPQFFKRDGKWKEIDSTLVEDKNAGDSGNIFGRVLGNVQSWLKEETTFTVKENDWQARFAPSDSEQGMVRVKYKGSQLGFSPVGAKKVNPVIKTDSNGRQTVYYYDLWPGVDVEYAVMAAQLKENIVLRSSSSTASFAFTISGGSLKKGKTDHAGNYGYDITGVLDNDFSIAPLVIILNNYGIESNQPLTQKLSGNKLSISIDREYLRDLPKDAYPVVVDPTVARNVQFGTRAGGNYGSFKSDGSFCPSSICNPLAGSVLDTAGIWRHWRGIIYSDYHEVKGKQLNSATLHLTQRLGLGSSGTTATKNFKTWHATCFDYSCLGVGSSTVAIGTVGDIDVTSIYQGRMNVNDYDAWLMITGEETAATTYKNWDPDNSYVRFVFTDVIPSPTITSPVEGQVYIDPQVSFSSTKHTNPASGAALQYRFCVSTSPSCGGAVMISSYQASAQWTIPDGLLQDGNTYYVQAQSYDPAVPVESVWGSAHSFKVDSRTGKDTTQSYDTLGPVSVDLATGNATVSANSHSSSALGGSMGISLDYNSPMRSRNGLVGKYWNLPTNAPDSLPTTDPSLMRVDQNVDFNWDLGSPAAGVVNNDWYYAQWTGYFVAPTAGTYYFGGKNDDYLNVYINGQQLYLNGGCYSGPCYGSNGILLTAGQVVPVDIRHKEVTSTAYAQLWVKGAVTEQIMPASWLQTGARDTSSQYGLTGRYYKDTGNHDFTDSANTMLMQRNDKLVSFNWGWNAAVPGGSSDGFMVRWTGYVTVPVSGSYQFGTTSDDGSRITLDTSNTVVFSKWNTDGGSTLYGTAYNLTANVPTPITVDYFEHSGPAKMFLNVKSDSLGLPGQVVPSSWLSYTARVLPAGWNMGIDPDGNVSYDHIKITANSAILADSTGSNHEYKWDAGKKSYLPPVNEEGQLTRNDDATYTFQDSDGRTYVFNADGTIQSVTSPVDDQKPAALQYSYGGTPSHLTQITDGVDNSRWAKVFYSGSSECVTPPSGFDLAPPVNMLCAVKTNDGRVTSFFYKDSRLSRIAEPGNELTDYEYDTAGRITAIRDILANDAVGASVRTDDASTETELTYDNIGRIVSVKQPAATAGANRVEHTVAYFPGNGTYFGATEQHVTGTSEPNGFTRRIEYDNLLRTTRDTDIANLSEYTEWDQFKDLIYSTTDETGLKSTTIYDDVGRAITQYGPAPAAWYGTDRKPLTAYTSQVPRTDTAYDENMLGPNVAYYAYSSASRALTGAPKLHSTNLTGATAGQFNKTYTSSPVPGVTNDWGFRATGRIRLPATGAYNIRIYSDGGVRLYIDDKLELDDWNDGAAQSHPDISFDNTAGDVHKIRVEYYHRSGDAVFQLYMTPPGGSETLEVNQYISPDYSLPTSAKTYDSTLGDSVATTNYGSSPELGMAQSTSVDPSGLNLTTTNTYETQGATGSLLRQTSKNLPGNPSNNPSFTYEYYGATETRDNPCTTGTTEAYKQAGFMKFKTEADPDGTGSQASRKTETVYDDTGKAVATRYNNDDWTCTTYDSRGRVTQTTVPPYNSEASRTITNVWAVDGNPLQTASYDGNGWIIVTTDLLGRTVNYTDVYGDWTGYEYNTLSQLIRKFGDMGEEIFYYDQYNRLGQHIFDGVTYATVEYDSYSRIDYIDYDNAGQMRLTLGRDSLGRTTSMTYRMGDGTTQVVNTVARTQSGQINGESVISGSNTRNSTFTYDGADRLTGATIDSNTYAYGFGVQDSTTCGTGSDTNPESGKNSNRTSQTINGVTSYFCYDYADRLTGSSNPLYTNPTYDSHGNMTALGTYSTTPMLGWIGYDSSDRSSGFEQYDNAGNGLGRYYDRDVQGRIIARYHCNIVAWDWQCGGNNQYYSFTGSGDSPDFVRDDNWTIVEKHLSLPGGVLLTVKPTQTGNNQKQYSLPNVHGDTLLTATATGTNTSNGNGPLNSFGYDPFGVALPGSVLPANTTNGSYAWVGQHQKMSESSFTLTPIQMGARVYIPSLGRFLQVDPVEGGTENSYVYPTNPVNNFDLDGKFCMPQGRTPLPFLHCKYNATFERGARQAANWVMWGSLGVAGAAAAGGCVITWAACTAAASRGVTVVLPKLLKNTVRIGVGRVSIGPAPGHFEKLGKLGKVLSPLHIHIEVKKLWIDFNWTGKGVDVYKWVRKTLF